MKKHIGVIGAGDCPPEVYNIAEELGFLIGKNGWVIICGGRRPFHDLSAGETAAPDLSGECGGGKTPPQISR